MDANTQQTVRNANVWTKNGAGYPRNAKIRRAEEERLLAEMRARGETIPPAGAKLWWKHNDSRLQDGPPPTKKRKKRKPKATTSESTISTTTTTFASSTTLATTATHDQVSTAPQQFSNIDYMNGVKFIELLGEVNPSGGAANRQILNMDKNNPQNFADLMPVGMNGLFVVRPAQHVSMFPIQGQPLQHMNGEQMSASQQPQEQTQQQQAQQPFFVLQQPQGQPVRPIFIPQNQELIMGMGHQNEQQQQQPHQQHQLQQQLPQQPQNLHTSALVQTTPLNLLPNSVNQQALNLQQQPQQPQQAMFQKSEQSQSLHSFLIQSPESSTAHALPNLASFVPSLPQQSAPTTTAAALSPIASNQNSVEPQSSKHNIISQALNQANILLSPGYSQFLTPTTSADFGTSPKQKSRKRPPRKKPANESPTSTSIGQTNVQSASTQSSVQPMSGVILFNGQPMRLVAPLNVTSSSTLTSQPMTSPLMSQQSSRPSIEVPVRATRKRKPSRKSLSLGQSAKFRCNKCQRMFTCMVDLEQHYLHESHEHTCSVCGHVAVSLPQLIAHVSLDHEQGFKCPKCSRRFNRLHYLKTHLKEMHDEVRPYKCSYCPLHFKRQPHLTRHIRQIHDTNHQPNNTCPVPGCDKVFNRADRLRDHVAGHNDERAYACLFCEKRFNRAYDRKRHINRVHWRRRPKSGADSDPSYHGNAIRDRSETHRLASEGRGVRDDGGSPAPSDPAWTPAAGPVGSDEGLPDQSLRTKIVRKRRPMARVRSIINKAATFATLAKRINKNSDKSPMYDVSDEVLCYKLGPEILVQPEQENNVTDVSTDDVICSDDSPIAEIFNDVIEAYESDVRRFTSTEELDLIIAEVRAESLAWYERWEKRQVRACLVDVVRKASGQDPVIPRSLRSKVDQCLTHIVNTVVNRERKADVRATMNSMLDTVAQFVDADPSPRPTQSADPGANQRKRSFDQRKKRTVNTVSQRLQQQQSQRKCPTAPTKTISRVNALGGVDLIAFTGEEPGEQQRVSSTGGLSSGDFEKWMRSIAAQPTSSAGSLPMTALSFPTTSYAALAPPPTSYAHFASYDQPAPLAVSAFAPPNSLAPAFAGSDFAMPVRCEAVSATSAHAKRFVTMSSSGQFHIIDSGAVRTASHPGFAVQAVNRAAQPPDTSRHKFELNGSFEPSAIKLEAVDMSTLGGAFSRGGNHTNFGAPVFTDRAGMNLTNSMTTQKSPDASPLNLDTSNRIEVPGNAARLTPAVSAFDLQPHNSFGLNAIAFDDGAMLGHSLLMPVHVMPAPAHSPIQTVTSTENQTFNP